MTSTRNPTDVWGIGCYDAPSGRRPWVIGNDEMRRDMGSASRAIGELGIGAGDRVLFCSMLSEAGQFWPWIVGVMLASAQLSCADATEGEAGRVCVLLRHLAFRAVFGVNDAVLDGCDARGVAYDELFAGIDIIGARPGAYERLRAAGLSPYRFALCGPAVAIGRAPAGAARVDTSEWALDEYDGIVRVTNRAPRATVFDRTPVAVGAQVVDDGRAITWPDVR